MVGQLGSSNGSDAQSGTLFHNWSGYDRAGAQMSRLRPARTAPRPRVGNRGQIKANGTAYRLRDGTAGLFHGFDMVRVDKVRVAGRRAMTWVAKQLAD